MLEQIKSKFQALAAEYKDLKKNILQTQAASKGMDSAVPAPLAKPDFPKLSKEFQALLENKDEKAFGIEGAEAFLKAYNDLEKLLTDLQWGLSAATNAANAQAFLQAVTRLNSAIGKVSIELKGDFAVEAKYAYAAGTALQEYCKAYSAWASTNHKTPFTPPATPSFWVSYRTDSKIDDIQLYKEIITDTQKTYEQAYAELNASCDGFYNKLREIETNGSVLVRDAQGRQQEVNAYRSLVESIKTARQESLNEFKNNKLGPATIKTVVYAFREKRLATAMQKDEFTKLYNENIEQLYKDFIEDVQAAALNINTTAAAKVAELEAKIAKLGNIEANK